MNFFHHSVESSTKTGSSSAGCPMSPTFADLSGFFKAISFLSHFSKGSGRSATVSIIQIGRESAWFFFFFFSCLFGFFFKF